MPGRTSTTYSTSSAVLKALRLNRRLPWASSGVFPIAVRTCEGSSDPDEQAEAMFRNLQLFMHEAGGTPDHIAHMTVFLKEEKYRDSVNKAWLKMFPDEHDRPARHALKAELRGQMLFQIEVIAVL